MGNVPLYMGEINSGFTKNTVLTQDQVCEYLKRLERFGSQGWAFWRWSYIHDYNIPAFNMAITDNNRIRPGIYFSYLKNAIEIIMIKKPFKKHDTLLRKNLICLDKESDFEICLHSLP
jgi:hypothetical protein